MKTIEEIIKKLIKNPTDYNIFIKFNSKTAIEKTALTNLIRKAISEGYIQKTDNNLLKSTKEGRDYINKLEGKENFPKRVQNKKISVNPQNAKLDSKIIADAYNIKSDFGEELLKIADEINNNAIFDCKDRIDLRNIKTITIDGETSKDLDDAISIEKIEDKYKVYVHISDVSHFIDIDSPLDLEARSRGNSSYLIDKVYNMFPEILSNNIMSLNENEDRFAITLIFIIDKEGNIIESNICRSLIKSDRRLSYDNAENIINKKVKVEEENWLIELMNNSVELKNILHKKRKEGIGLKFDNTDIKIILDEEGYPIEFYGEEKKESAHIIEELMLLANSEIAKKLKDYDGALYRYHGLPDEYRFNNFKILAHNKGYELKKLQNEDYDIKSFVENIKGKSEEKLLIPVLLRSMTPSSYSVINKSHFGLGFDYYTYFTSPIRRYADLIIHRIVKSVLIDGNKEIDSKLKDLCNDLSEKLSLLDKTSHRAEKDIRQVKAARYMKDRLGDEYYGIISSMSKNGITVEIEELEIEGFIEAYYVGSGYRFYQDMQSVFIDKVKAYELGDRVKIYVASVNVENGKINFSL